MSKRSDIIDGTHMTVWGRNRGLIYTCNAGWLDLGHLDPYNVRPEIGAHNLWLQVVNAKGIAPDPGSVQLPLESAGAALTGAPAPLSANLAQAKTSSAYKFADGSTGYLVRYRQDTGNVPGRPGREGLYVVKHGLSVDDKKSVALAIFVEISLRFEKLQLFAEWLGVGKSGFSQEDLVSNLIGFYIAIGDVTQVAAISACHPTSKSAALAIWDREGAVGQNKNPSFTPKLARHTGIDHASGCTDECLGEPRRFPRMFTRRRPAEKGQLFDDFPAY